MGRRVGWLDVLCVPLLGGVGFTISMLSGDFAFGAGSTADEPAKIGILAR